jgi:hypothetical protein
MHFPARAQFSYVHFEHFHFLWPLRLSTDDFFLGLADERFEVESLAC